MINEQRLNATEAPSSDRSIVLLGAGASADAGLLLTSELAGAILDKANESDSRSGRAAKPDWVRALNAIYAGMVGYQGARGDNPRSAVNIETLISAVRLLKGRDDHEVAPFVATWSPALSTFGSSSLPSFQGEKIAKGVEQALSKRGGFADHDITEAVARIAEAAVRPDLTRPLEDAEHFVMESLVELLSAHKDVEYLKPLLDLCRSQPGGLDVITLNYDLTIESAAAEEGITVNRGVTSWKPGEELSFPAVDDTLNLMKLHGSLDWHMQPMTQGGTLLSPSRIVVEALDLDRMKQQGRYSVLPWIVVGDRDKLATDGPTLALNFAARTAMAKADRLVVVGYSFRDSHINAMIRDWMAADEARTMTVLDRSWPRQYDPGAGGGFRDALIAGYAYATEAGSVNNRTPRAHLVEGSAANQLSRALSETPEPLPDPLASVSTEHMGDAIRLDVTWNGPALDGAGLEIHAAGASGSFAFGSKAYVVSRSLSEVQPASPDNWPGWVPRTEIPQWPSGVTETFFIPANLEETVELHVRGMSLVGSLNWRTLLGPSQPSSPPISPS